MMAAAGKAEEEEVIARIRRMIREAKSGGMTGKEIKRCFQEKGYRYEEEFDPYTKSCSILNCLLFKVYPVIFLLLMLSYPLVRMLSGYACLLVEVSPFGEVVNPMVNCDICEGVTGAPRLRNLSRDDFMRNYAYTSRPILVEGAVLNWSAVEVFSYDFFKELYMSRPESLEEDNSRGQFFAYSSNIGSLQDLFSLPSEVASMQSEKWYIGW